MKVSVEWELQGDYPEIERLASRLTSRLGERAQLSNSTLDYTPGDPAKTAARLTTVLAPLPGAFRQ